MYVFEFSNEIGLEWIWTAHSTHFFQLITSRRITFAQLTFRLDLDSVINLEFTNYGFHRSFH